MRKVKRNLESNIGKTVKRLIFFPQCSQVAKDKEIRKGGGGGGGGRIGKIH